MLRHVASIGLLLLLVLTGGALCQTLYGRWCSGGNVRGVARVCVCLCIWGFPKRCEHSGFLSQIVS